MSTSLNACRVVDALALLLEACERGEKNLRPYLDAGHAAIDFVASSSAAGEPVGERQGWQLATKTVESRCPDGNSRCDGTDLLHGDWCRRAE